MNRQGHGSSELSGLIDVEQVIDVENESESRNEYSPEMFAKLREFIELKAMAALRQDHSIAAHEVT